MDEQNITNATPTTEQAQPTSTATEKTGGRAYTEAEVEQIIKERVDRERSKREQAAKEAAEKAKAEEAAKQGDFEKLLKLREQELEDVRKALKVKEREDMRRAAAEKVGLPAALVSRLVGDTAEELEADAKKLLDALPKAPRPQPGPIPTNPANAEKGETTSQRLARIHGQQSDPFDLDVARSKGGGLYWPKSEE